jgi:hypothetical protein
MKGIRAKSAKTLEYKVFNGKFRRPKHPDREGPASHFSINGTEERSIALGGTALGNTPLKIKQPIRAPMRQTVEDYGL